MIVFIAQKLISAQFWKMADEFKTVTYEATELWRIIESHGQNIESFPILSELINIAH